MKDIANKRLIACGACNYVSGGGGGGGRGGGTGGAGYTSYNDGGVAIVPPSFAVATASPGASGVLTAGGNGGNSAYQTVVGVTPMNPPPIAVGGTTGDGATGTRQYLVQGGANYYSWAGSGGGGGGFAGSGGPGGSSTNYGTEWGSPGPAGSGGAAIAGNAFITWVGATGTRYGTVA